MFGSKAVKNVHGTESAIPIKLVLGNRGAAVMIKGAKSTLICHAAVVLFLAMRSDCIALPVDLGVEAVRQPLDHLGEPGPPAGAGELGLGRVRAGQQQVGA